MANGVRPGQRECGEWTDRNFLPGDNLERRALVLAEETGEAVRCVLKMQQGIRGTRDEWMAELRKELGDVQGALYALAHRAGIDLDDAWSDRWLDLSKRDFKGNPQQQGIPS